MQCRLPSSRRVAWGFALLLLLKAAMPMLAVASAQAQGKALVEVCTVYGVATVVLDEQGPGPAPTTDHAAAHGGEQCTLPGLAALATPQPQPVLLPAPQCALPAPACHASPPAPDACAAWVARLKHGPPTHS